MKIAGSSPQPIASVLSTMDLFLQLPYPILVSYVMAENQKIISSVDSNSIISVLAKILGIKDMSTIDYSRKLRKYGVDSLINLEIRQTLDKFYNILLPVTKIPDLTIKELLELTTKPEGNGEIQSESKSSDKEKKDDYK